MGISMGKTGRSEVSDINITPMIDVLLVLLVIFMLAQQVMLRSIDIQLPVDRDRNPNAVQATQIILEIGADGSYKINTQPVPRDQLAARLKEIYTGRPDKVLLVKADGQVTYGDVIAAMDVARGAGVKVLGSVLP